MSRRSARVRIVGGQWGGRRIAVPAAGVRPSSDRARETLFNWLAPLLPGARCLDLFAGTGALGLEALSRGAAEAVIVERQRRVAAALRDALTGLGAADRARVEPADARAFLRRGPGAPFDLAFLDPPYAERGLLEACCRELALRGWLGAAAHIYIENEIGAGAPELPPGWEPIRRGRAGRSELTLIRCE